MSLIAGSTPARYSALPGLPFGGDPDRYPHRDEVVDYLRRYAAGLDVEIETGRRVVAVIPDGSGFVMRLADGAELTAPQIICATGEFGYPHRPALRGLDGFSGTVLHAADYRNPMPYAGQRVVVVGSRSTAVQIATELASCAEVTLAYRTPVRFAPQRPLGRDLHFWLNATGLDRNLAFGRRLRRRPPAPPVLDAGRYRAALSAGRPASRPMFTGIDGDHVIWPDGTRERVDTILLATGYRPNFGYLESCGALDSTGRPLHENGLSTVHTGLSFIGLPQQRTLSSATLRGVGRDATHVVSRLAITSGTHA